MGQGTQCVWNGGAGGARAHSATSSEKPWDPHVSEAVLAAGPLPLVPGAPDKPRPPQIWMAVQRKWMYLESIFIGGDIRSQLPDEAKKFDNIDRVFKRASHRCWWSREGWLMQRLTRHDSGICCTSMTLVWEKVF